MADEPMPEPPKRHRRRWLVALLAVLAIVIAFMLGLWPRLSRRERVRRDTEAMRIPTVAVVRPELSAVAMSIVLPGNVQAYLDAPIFSRISGYLDRWLVDIGARVKKDQLLAVISVPEAEQQLQQARHTLAMSEANRNTSKETATRFTKLAGTRAVSPQEVDTAVGAFQANQATVNANQSLVRQLEQQLGYAQIRAPFDGIITVRNVNVGDLINAGSSTVPRTELFHVVQPDTLRVYTSVPEPYAQTVKPGLVADVTFTTYPGRTFQGTVTRTAKAIEPSTRILNVELRVDNTTGILFTGAYAQVHLSVPAPASLKVPVATLIFQAQGLQVATVVDNKVVLKNVTPGHDHGEWLEIVAGVTDQDLVVNNPSDAIATGQEVRVTQVQPQKPPSNQQPLQ